MPETLPRLDDKVRVYCDYDGRHRTGVVKKIEGYTFSATKYWLEFTLTDKWERKFHVWLDYKFKDGKWSRYQC